MAKAFNFREWLAEQEKVVEERTRSVPPPRLPRRLVLVGYDKHARRDYSEVGELFSAAGGQRVLDSTWLFKTTLTAEELRRGIESLFENDEQFFVGEVGARSHRLAPADERWIGLP